MPRRDGRSSPFLDAHPGIGLYYTLAELQCFYFGTKGEITPTHHEIWTLLEECGTEMSAEAIAEHLDLPLRSVRIILGRMAGTEKLRKVARGIYRLSEQHEANLIKYRRWPWPDKAAWFEAA